ncbi:MAG: SPRY domain-containing protein [Clostridiaceae bacterium]
MSEVVIWDSSSKYGNVTIGDNGLDLTLRGASVGIIANKSHSTGKKYFEIYIANSSNLQYMIGLSNNNYNGTDSGYKASRYILYGYDRDLWDGIVKKGVIDSKPGAGSTIGLLFDGDAKILRFSVNGIIQNAFLDNLKGDFFSPVASFGSNSGNGILSANFGATPFKYKPPKGYSSWDGSQTYPYYLIQDQSNVLWTFKDDILIKSNNILSEEAFINDGFADYDVVNNKTIDKIGLQGVDKGVLGNGKYFEVKLENEMIDVSKIILDNNEYTENLIIGKSYTGTPSYISYPLKNAFDGNSSTIYQANGYRANIVIDFEVSEPLEKYNIMFGMNSSQTNISMSYSDDSSEWVGVPKASWTGSVTNSTNVAIEFGDVGHHRYWQFNISSSDNWTTIRELEMMKKINGLALIKYNNEIYTYKESQITKTVNQNIDELNFEENGFSDIVGLTKDTLKKNFENIEEVYLIFFTKISNKGNLVVLVSTTPKPSNQWLIDNKCKLLMWTDDIEKTEATMTYELKTPYKPIDILKKNNDGICNILMSKN